MIACARGRARPAGRAQAPPTLRAHSTPDAPADTGRQRGGYPTLTESTTPTMVASLAVRACSGWNGMAASAEVT